MTTFVCIPLRLSPKKGKCRGVKHAHVNGQPDIPPSLPVEPGKSHRAPANARPAPRIPVSHRLVVRESPLEEYTNLTDCGPGPLHRKKMKPITQYPEDGFIIIHLNQMLSETCVIRSFCLQMLSENPRWKENLCLDPKSAGSSSDFAP